MAGVVIVSGASRGIGKEIVTRIAEIMEPESAFVLTARNADALQDLKSYLNAKYPSFDVRTIICDLEKFESSISQFNEVFENITANKEFDAFYLFHNAGTLGDVTQRGHVILRYNGKIHGDVLDRLHAVNESYSNTGNWHKKLSESLCLNDSKDWQKYMNVNLISMIQFNNTVLQHFSEKICKKRFVVNISSLVAVLGFPSFSQYSVGKAAREAFFRVLASEEETLRVLNYCPGPVDTDMYEEVTNKIHASLESDDKPTESKKALSPTQTVNKMIKILQTNQFESGGRIDYFDDEKC